MTECPTIDWPHPKATDDPLVAQADAKFTKNYGRIHDLAVKQHWRLRGDTKNEAVQETLAFTMKAFRDLSQRGADPEMLLPHVVRFAGKRWYEQKRFAGKVPVQDALSQEGRKRNGHFVTSLPASDDEEVAGEVRDSLRHRVAGPAAEAILKTDYEAFLASLTANQREVTEGLVSGLNLSEIAEQRGTSRAATQQVAESVRGKWTAREGYERDWDR